MFCLLQETLATTTKIRLTEDGIDMKVCCLTNFNEADHSFSLNNVVEDQIKMLVKNGHQAVVLVTESFIPVRAYTLPGVEIRKIPSVPVSNEVEADPTFEEDVKKLEESIDEALKDVNVVLTHDIIYQPAALKHNIACRKIAARRPELTWYHWIHSATSPYSLIDLRPFFKDEYVNIIQSEFPNSYMVFFNHYSIQRIATNFNVDEDRVKIVHHPIDIPGYLGFHPITERLFYDKKLYSADAITVYPVRLDRGKQVEHVIRIMALLKTKFNQSIRVIIPDFHSTGGDKIAYREELKQLGSQLGLSENDLTFMSEFDESLKGSCPREIVRDLMLISNAFIMPSVSESYSLIAQEALLTGKVAMFNGDFPPFRDIFGSAPFFRKFSSNIDITTGLDGETKTKYDSEDGYFTECAGRIYNELTTNRVSLAQTKIRKERNLMTVFKKELEPLLFYRKES